MSQMSASRRHRGGDDNHASLYHDLIETNAYLKTLRDDEPRLASQFAAWRDHRKLTIYTVCRLQKKIDAIFVGCNAARGAGAAAGIVGFGAWAAGIGLMTITGHVWAAQFLRASKYFTGASAVTMTSSTLLEFGLTQSSMNEIKRVLKKDVELTQSLQKWIQLSHKVESLFYSMFQCNVLSTTFSNIIKVCGHSIAMLDAGLVAVEDLIRDLQSSKMKDMEDWQFEISQKVLDFFRKVQKNPRLLTPMKAICRIFDETPDVSEFVKLTTDIYWISFDIFSGPLAEVLCLKDVGSPNKCDFQNCILNAAIMMSNVANFILAVKNVQEGKSKYSEALDTLKNALKSELEGVTMKMSDRF